MKIKRGQIITHRGLEPDRPDFWSESSYEAFQSHLNRGFGIEFDVNFTSDENIIITHDTKLARLTAHEARLFSLNKGRIPFLNEILDMIRTSPSSVNALHLKGQFQKSKFLKPLITALKSARDIFNRLIIFDVKEKTARCIKREIPDICLSPSVAHQFDIKRYNSAANGTLLSIAEALRLKKEKLIDAVWLDEWDLMDQNGGSKTLYNKKNFNLLKSAGLRIYLVTPELHATSPNLLGGEAHPDGRSKKHLYKRIKQIIRLQPDALCTDHPEEILSL